jgi:hypothetical protein
MTLLPTDELARLGLRKEGVYFVDQAPGGWLARR